MLLLFLFIAFVLADESSRLRRRTRFALRRTGPATALGIRSRPKPPWVKREIIRLKALMPQSGCRTLADTFNRRFAATRQMTVGKTYVSDTIREHQYEIQILRRKIKHAKPRPVPRNLVWALDLTGKTDAQGAIHSLLGLIDHGSRACFALAALRDKATLTLLRILLDAIEHFGKPRILRTDNEAMFTSWLFRFILFSLGIRHQRTDPGCPWQNGRIERFFGTLKGKLNQIEVASLDALSGALSEFEFWYNHVRPHQNLNGRTPAEVWARIDVFNGVPPREYWFEAWEGLLTGFYLRR